MDVSLHDRNDLDRLRRGVRQEANAKQRDRYRVVLLALEGKTEPEIRLRTDRSRGFIQRWVYAYREAGLDGLKVRKPPGKPPKLSNEQHQAFRALLDQPNAPRRGVDVQVLLADQFGVNYSLRGAVLLLHRLGYEPLQPRPVNPKKDSEAEAVWKQTAPLLSKPSERNTPTSKSKCGSRTNAGLARRDA
jgi:transposase